MQRIFILFLLFTALAVASLQAQDPANVNVNALTDQQIQQIVKEVQARGLTIDEAAQMARLQGATPVQIEQLKKRIEELELPEEKKPEIPDEQIKPKSKAKTEKISEKAIVEPTRKMKKIFGFQIFNSENLTFEPPVNIPTPQNYVLGIADELIVSVWGASQKTYQLTVEANGAVQIPDLGPVFVSGMEFSKARELIKKRLITIYRGIGGPSPDTWADVAISNLRSIRINVIGEVMAPGTYTLPSTASAFNALYLSGGPNENGSFRNIQLIRDNKLIRTIDVYDYLINARMEGNISLREQDILYIPTWEKRVEASGAFKRTGLFELTEKERLSDLIRYLGGFSEKAYKAQISLTRITEKEKRVIDISQSIYDSFLLSNGDSVVASEIINRFENRVNISGAVFRPGTYELNEGLSLSGLIRKAQGVKENYFANRGLIIRLQNNLTPMTLSFNVDEVLNGTNDLPLQREDQVIIQNVLNLREKRTVQIFGEVQKQGEYEFSDNMSLKDLIFKAGGFNEAASESFIELARRHSYAEANQISDELVKLYQFNIDRELKMDVVADRFILLPFDYVYVRKAPSYNTQRTVYIEGEVRYPGSYSIGSKNERISDLIKRAGGLMPNAFIKGARMKRANQLAEQSLETLHNTAEDSLLSKVGEQIKNDQLELRLDHILKNPGTPFDYLLKDGDQIVVPELSQEVRISGEIQNPIGLAYEQGRNLKYYVNRSGGFGENAKKNKVFVIYSDGITKVTRNYFWHSYPVIEPGSQIIVPPKPERPKTDSTGKWMAIASTLSTILIAISTLAK